MNTHPAGILGCSRRRYLATAIYSIYQSLIISCWAHVLTRRRLVRNAHVPTVFSP